MNEIQLKPQHYLLSFLFTIILLIYIGPFIISYAYEFIGARSFQSAYRLFNEPTKDAMACMVITQENQEALEKINNALRYLQTAVKYNSNTAHPFLLLGRGYCLTGQFPQAIQAYNHYVALRPKSPLGNLELGFAYESAGDLKSALYQWKKIHIESTNFLVQGNELRTLGLYREALEWFNRANLAGNDEAIVYYFYVQGLLFEQQGLLEEAIESYKETILLGKKQKLLVSSAYYKAGIIEQEMLGDWIGAFYSFSQAIIADDFLTDLERADTHNRKGIILKYGMNEPRLAMQEFENAINSYNDHYGSLIELGISYWDLEKDFVLAEVALKRAISANPHAKFAYIILGNIYLEVENYNGSKAMYEQAIKIDPSDTSVIDRLLSIEETNSSTDN
jgi:tetratricopeptide (TPR) repeat protein